MRTTILLLITLLTAAAYAGQPSVPVSFSSQPASMALTEGALALCEGQADKFGDGTGSGDNISPSCLVGFYAKANPTAVRSDPDDSDFAFGFRNVLFMRTPQVTLVPSGKPGNRTRSVNPSRLADVIVTGHSSKLREVQALSLDGVNEEVHVLDSSGMVMSFPLGVGGNLVPARAFTAADPGDISSIATDNSDDQLILVRTGAARLDFHSRRADADGHQSWSATGAQRSLGGPHTGLVGPVDAVVAEQAGELIVLDRAGNQILIYVTTASGDVTPTRVIRGALTGLSSPQAVSYTASTDRITVWNGNGSSLTFARTVSGDVAPIPPGP